MSEELGLVTQLAIILVAAGVMTVISRALKQPLILGYIVAGFLVGPHLGLFPQFSQETVKVWSEIGIIFLLFSLGLEFSFKKLLQVGSSALIMACTKCVGMFFVGIIVGNVIGWTMMESIFLGGLLSMSSTTVIIKAYDDMGLSGKPYAPVIFGSLVFEDLIAVLLMVLLSTLAASNRFAGGEMVIALAKLAFFLILWFLIGIYLIPTLLKRAKKYLSDEILLIVSIGLCFGMVALANAMGFSSALGAFMMGSILSETMEGEHISKLTTGIKDLFGTIFFVSIGMMVDPSVLGEHWLCILGLTIAAMGGILIFTTLGAILSGKGLDTAVHAGFTLAQLGEFSFIIAGLGCSLGVMRDFIYPVIITISVITTFATPFMIKAADPATVWLGRKLPKKILDRIDPPQGIENREEDSEEKNEWMALIKSYLLRIGLYSVILIAILSVSRAWLVKLVAAVLPQATDAVRGIICAVVTVLVMAPFLYGMSVTNGSINAPARKLFRISQTNRWSIIAMIVLRVMIAVVFVVSAITAHLKLSFGILLLIALAVFVLISVSKFTLKRFTSLETRFMENFNAKEIHERKNAPVTAAFKDRMAGYDVHIKSFEVSSDFSYAGSTLKEMPFRGDSGVNIVKIIRGAKGIEVPSGDEKVFPGDKLLAVGTEEQLDAFEKFITDSSKAEREEVKEKFDVWKLELTADSNLTGLRLKDSGIKASGCLVVSVSSDGSLIANPPADYLFKEGDLVWIAGAESSVKRFE